MTRMRKYELKYIDENGLKNKEYIYVENIDDAIDKASKTYNEVLEIYEVKFYYIEKYFNNNKITNTMIYDFCDKLNILLKSGITIQKSLDIIETQIKNRVYKEKIKLIKYNILNGNTLSYSLNEVGMPNFMCTIIEVGETAGKLEEVLELLYNYYYDQNKIVKIIKNAIYYPIIVTIAMIIAIAIAVFKVIPNYETIFQSNETELPNITKTIINISYFINEYIFILLLIIVFIVIGILIFTKSKRGKIFIDYVKYNALIITAYKSLINYNFSMSMYVLLNSSIDIIKSLDITKNVMNNKIISNDIEEIKKYIKGGMSLSYSLTQYNEFDYIMISLCSIGEQTGDLSNVFLKSSNMYKKDIDNFLDTLERKIEIIVTIALGIILAFVILSIILPTYSIINTM